MNTSTMNVIYTIDVCNSRYMAGMLDGIYVSLLLGLVGLILYSIINLNKSEKIIVNVYTYDSEVYEEDEEDDDYEDEDDECEDDEEDEDEDEDENEDEDEDEDEEDETPKKSQEPVELEEKPQERVNETTQEKPTKDVIPTVTEDALD